MLKEALSFYKDIQLNKNDVEKILSFNYSALDSMSDLDLSKNCIILSQYLVYFRWQLNNTKADQLTLKNKLESTIFHLTSADLVKQFKTKVDIKSYLITNVSELASINQEIEAAEYELVLADGMEKPVQEMINVLKREQSRRENELMASKFERR